MSLPARHRIVVHAQRARLGKPHWKVHQRRQTLAAGYIQIQVYAAVVVQDEVLCCVDALDRMAVGVPGWEKPGVVMVYQLEDFGLIPDVDGEGWIVLDAEVWGVGAGVWD